MRKRLYSIAANLFSIEGWKPAISKLFALHLYIWRACEIYPSVIVSFKSLIVSSKPSKLFNFRSSYRLLVLMKKSLAKSFSFCFMCLSSKNVSNFSCSMSTFPDSISFWSFQSDSIWLLVLDFVSCARGGWKYPVKSTLLEPSSWYSQKLLSTTYIPRGCCQCIWSGRIWKLSAFFLK